MKRKIYKAFALLWMFLFPFTARSSNPSGPIVLGYYPAYGDVTPDKIDFRKFTHLVHAFVTVDAQGGLHVEGNVPSADLTRLAHAANVRVSLGVGGDGNGPAFSGMLRNPSAVKAFIANIMAMVAEYRYDGVDIDFEFPGKDDEQPLDDLMAALRKRMQATEPGFLLTMAVPCKEEQGKCFDAARLCPLVDFLEVMSYDVHGPWKEGEGLSHSGFNAPLNPTASDPVDGRDLSFQAFAGYWEKRGFPKGKLLMGIPCFGHGFAVGQWGVNPTKLSKHSDIAYQEIKGLLDAGWKRHWSDDASVPWLQSPNGAELISYDDEKSAFLKGKWAAAAGVRGIFFWEITQDLVDGRNVLVKAARKGLGLPGR